MFLIKTDNQLSERESTGTIYLRGTVLKAPEGFEAFEGARLRFNEKDSAPVLAKTGTYLEADFDIGTADESDKGHRTYQCFNGTVVRELGAEESAPLKVAERKAQLMQALAVAPRVWTSNAQVPMAAAGDEAAATAATADLL